MKLTSEQFRAAFLESEGRGPFFTSDLHVDHKNIIEYCKRPWTYEEQHKEIVTRWNSRVGLMDDVYHLGDFVFAGSSKAGKIIDLISQLNGRIHFIRGNHCQPGLWQLIEDANLPHVIWIKDYKEITVQGQRIILCHYPMETWHGAGHGNWMLHGHCHGSLAPRGKRLDVGIDNHPDHQVFCYAEVAAHMARQKIAIVDHHDGRRP